MILSQGGRPPQPNPSPGRDSEDQTRNRERRFGEKKPAHQGEGPGAHALVLAAHGSHADPECNARVRRWARELARRLPFDEVHAAFHQGTPVFAEVLDQLEAATVTIVPVMTSAGYYATQVLPRELAKNFTYPDKRVHLTPPVGTHSAMAPLLRRRVMVLAEDFGFESSRATVVLVGHGTPRRPASRLATLALADELRATEAAGQVLATFLDDEPRIATVPEAADGDPLLVIPFFIGVGMHPARDVPAACGSAANEATRRALAKGASPWERDSAALPREERIGRKRFIFDQPVGCDEGVTDILAALAGESFTARSEPSPSEPTPSEPWSQAQGARSATGPLKQPGHGEPAS